MKILLHKVYAQSKASELLLKLNQDVCNEHHHHEWIDIAHYESLVGHCLAYLVLEDDKKIVRVSKVKAWGHALQLKEIHFRYYLSIPNVMKNSRHNDLCTAQHH